MRWAGRLGLVLAVLLISGCASSPVVQTNAAPAPSAESAPHPAGPGTPSPKPPKAPPSPPPQPKPLTDGNWLLPQFAKEAQLRPGRTIRLKVRVEAQTKVEPQQFAAAVAQILHDRRSWSRFGTLHFDLVGPKSKADLTLNLASPTTTDRLCLPAQTNGWLSCRNGDTVNLNVDRWRKGIPDYRGDMITYRQYLINHEVGHFLYAPHENCPGSGKRAPLMMQQTKGLDGCTKNGWPDRRPPR